MKLFPKLSSIGIIALSPDLVRHKPNFKEERYQDIIDLIGKFLINAFEIKNISNGIIEKIPPLDTVEFNSTDKFPVYATYYETRDSSKDVLLYPQRYKSRLYYEEIGKKLNGMGVNVMIANNNRTCRYSDEEYLCDREIKGAVEFLIRNNKIREDMIIGVFPAAYFIAVDRLLEKKQMNLNKVILKGKPDANAYVDPVRLQNKFNNVIYIDSMDKNNLLKVLLQLIR